LRLSSRRFKKTVTSAKALGILKLGHLSIAGTKMKANASKNYTLSKAEIEAIREIIERGIAIDEEEDKLYGDKRGDELPPELNTQQKMSERVNMSITVSRCTHITVRTVVNARSDRSAQVKAK